MCASSGASRAGPRLRAGFRLLPVYGAHCQTRAATSARLPSGVHRAGRGTEQLRDHVPGDVVDVDLALNPEGEGDDGVEVRPAAPTPGADRHQPAGTGEQQPGQQQPGGLLGQDAPDGAAGSHRPADRRQPAQQQQPGAEQLATPLDPVSAAAGPAALRLPAA
jgi:hypothetical protein